MPAQDIYAPPTANSNSKASKQSRTAARISDASTRLYPRYVQELKAFWNEIWANPDGLSPADAAAALGEKGKAAFDRFATQAGAVVANAWTGFLCQGPAGPVTVAEYLAVPSGYTVSYPNGQDGHPDGTALVTEPS